MSSSIERPKVILTGFGPFKDHVTNDSWASVCQVAQGDRGKDLENRLGIQFIIKELAVCYEVTDCTVPLLWTDHHPQFVLHVGIHPYDVFKIETRAKRTEYDNPDIEGKIPDECVCNAGVEEVIQSKLDTIKLLSDVQGELQNRKVDVDIQLSDDPGRYLCAYTFYTSLCKDPRKTLFLHIPPPTSSIPISHKADIIEIVVTKCLQQVRMTQKSV